jgi:hypothetical protein
MHSLSIGGGIRFESCVVCIRSQTAMSCLGALPDASCSFVCALVVLPAAALSSDCACLIAAWNGNLSSFCCCWQRIYVFYMHSC